jgi:hypothetical protein
MSIDLASASILVEDASHRERAKERLYVLLQSGGWLVFLGLQLAFILGVPHSMGRNERMYSASVVTMLATSGWLITHFSRRLIARWKWKDLGWRALLPRVVGFSIGQGFGWMLFAYGYPYAVCRPPMKIPLGVAIAAVWINLAIVMAGWWCIYFFYHLFDRYNRSEIERLRLRATVKDAELRALKSQVNPHFIFNALNSLRALIDEEPARARQAVTQLANLLRYSLQSGQLETVPFEDELRIVNDYLALEQVRLEERLRVRLDVEPDTLGLPIPPLLLQTLVENAVKYGISNRPEGGEIAIVARREGDSLRLQVTNPGSIEVTPAKATLAAASTGVGLRNAAERLRLLFGDRATLRLHANPPATVVAEAILPVQPVRA